MHARERQDQSHSCSALFQQATFRPVHMRQDLRPFVQSHAIERLAPGEGYDGAFRERGFCSVELQSPERNGIFAGLPEQLTVWESHCDEVKELPQDFVRTARNDVSEIQAIQHASLPLFGVQFHPELFDEDHPHGRQILENFLKL